MEKVMNCYETTFIVDTSKGDAVVDATVEKFCGLVAANAEVVDIDKWGKRRLAYAINDLTEGYYTVVTFKCDGKFCAELDRHFNIDENILRSFILKLEFEPVKKPVASEPVQATEEAPAETTAE
jgi:small subunit ribosomal protein S6